MSEKRRKSKLSILYLAKHAPKSIEKPQYHPQDGIAPIYHHEIYQRLKDLNFNVISSNSIASLFEKNLRFDYVFSLYNRAPFRNSEIFISSYCEYIKKPYLGAPPNIRAVAEDKHIAKLFAKALNVQTPDWVIYRVGCDINRPHFDPPYFIKPRFGAASEYISDDSISYSWQDAKKKITFLFSNNLDVILEQFIDGENITIPIITVDEKYEAFPCIEAVSNNEGNISTYFQKRRIETGLLRSEYTTLQIASQIKNYALSIYEQIQPIDYARFDFRIETKTKRIYFLEFNVCSNLGSHSSICQSASLMGLSQVQILKTILESSFKRQNIIWH